jgi:hypothetical protein
MTVIYCNNRDYPQGKELAESTEGKCFFRNPKYYKPQEGVETVVGKNQEGKNGIPVTNVHVIGDYPEVVKAYKSVDIDVKEHKSERLKGGNSMDHTIEQLRDKKGDMTEEEWEAYIANDPRKSVKQI